MLGRTSSTEFASLISKIPTTKVAGIYKKIMKIEYQLVFEFINKVLLPRTEKRIVATTADLFVMEMLCSFEALSLPSLIIEHIHKTVIERKGVHGMGYGYFLTKVFKHFRIPLSPRVPWLSANALKEESIQREKWPNLLMIRSSLSMRLRSLLCG